MNLSELPRLVTPRNKRLGRGHGSGKVKTAGRGTKGQRSREKIRAGFEGGQLPLIKRLPMLRGRGRNRSLNLKPRALPVAKLAILTAGSRVDTFDGAKPLAKASGKMRRSVSTLSIPRSSDRDVERVDLVILRKAKLINPETSRVKIVAGGKLSKPLIVDLPCSKGATEAIIRAGGKVIFQEKRR